MKPWVEVLLVFTKLGLSSFGGPLAHLAYFQQEFVVRRRWLEADAYSDLVALCQFLPGPASSQVGMALGLMRAGLPGAIAAWLGFTLPSAILLVLFGMGLNHLNLENTGWLHGLKLVALAVVSLAVWSMAHSLAPDRLRASIAVLTAVVLLTWSSNWLVVGVLVVAGFLGVWLIPASLGQNSPTASSLSRPMGLAALTSFGILLVALPLLHWVWPHPALELFERLYRTGALVFGGGHAVLPLMQAELVSTQWISQEQFVAGYGAAQAIPGPLFAFAGYIGSIAPVGINPWLSAGLALVAIFLPGFLLVVGVWPFWQALKQHPWLQKALKGVNAAIVGILLAALYQPIWLSSVHSTSDLALALGFGLLLVWKWPVWLVVGLAAGIGAIT